jgi:hypothetical protein
MGDITIEGIEREGAQRREDVRALNEILSSDGFFGPDGEEEWEPPEAFHDMRDRLASGRQQVLTPKQRWWVNRVARQLDVEPSDGPENDPKDDAPPMTRLTSGPIPKGRDVELLVKDKPLKPPGRRA